MHECKWQDVEDMKAQVATSEEQAKVMVPRGQPIRDCASDKDRDLELKVILVRAQVSSCIPIF